MMRVFTQSTGWVAKHATVPLAMAQARCKRRSLAKPAFNAWPFRVWEVVLSRTLHLRWWSYIVDFGTAPIWGTVTASVEDQSPKSQSLTAFPNFVPATETKALETKATMFPGQILDLSIHCHLTLQIQFDRLRHYLLMMWDSNSSSKQCPFLSWLDWFSAG